jgi:site-specific DNA recombinase
METRPQAEWIEVEVPALIDEAVWNRAQERLKMNQRFASRHNTQHFYLLRSLLVCGTCGYTLQGRSQNERVYYYCEYGGKNRYPDVPRHTCSIAGPIIEPLVWDALAELLHHPEQIATAWEIDTANQAAAPDELSRLQVRQRKLEQQWLRLLDAFQDGLLGKTELGERKQRLEQERQTITQRIEQIQRQEKQQSVKAQMMAEFATFCAFAQTALENPTPEVKQEVLRLLVESIVVEDEAITIKHIIPTDDNCRLLPRGNLPEMIHFKIFTRLA